ncbi:unnamed protein product [Soboliphyme baturini]|uniref:Deoxyribonuclease TATDN3 n=1 Tax=Soboliphyme baturini TaxID=241478 RepID=A0A183IV29_9BILA|nr:unnamed protein product [Soboliphyme baturini]
MIDCHCHLCDDQFDKDLSEVIERAKQAGVIGCLVNTENIPEFQKCFDLSERYPNFFLPCIGVHPVQYENENGEFIGRSVNENDVNGIEKHLRTNLNRVVAIGEGGSGSASVCKILNCTLALNFMLYNLPLRADLSLFHKNLSMFFYVGLDYTPRFIHSDTDKSNQKEVFRRQIELAKTHQLPVYRSNLFC